MDHDVVVRQKMTERYLLNELDPTSREEFEEHFFDCPECALDVRAGATFVEQSKTVLAEEGPARDAVTDSRNRKSGWFAWLRPAFAAPALAALLIVVGYQNLVTYPQLRRSLNQPQVLPWASVNVGTWGPGGPSVSIAPGKGFLLFVRIPPDSQYATYRADLYNPAGDMEWSVTIPASSTQDQYPLQVPGTIRTTGTYTMVIRGTTTAGASKDVGRASFELQIQN